jgi:hypothetical protein
MPPAVPITLLTRSNGVQLVMTRPPGMWCCLSNRLEPLRRLPPVAAQPLLQVMYRQQRLLVLEQRVSRHRLQLLLAVVLARRENALARAGEGKVAAKDVPMMAAPNRRSAAALNTAVLMPAVAGTPANTTE